MFELILALPATVSHIEQVWALINLITSLIKTEYHQDYQWLTPLGFYNFIKLWSHFKYPILRYSVNVAV